MGISGLKWYVSNNYFVPYELKSTPVIIDGNGIAIKLSNNPDVDLRFGGDYNTMYERMYKFFDRLLKFDVTPIVIMDGRFKDEKKGTIKQRAKTSFDEVKQYNQNCNISVSFIFYLLKTEVFLNVLKDLKIFVCRADFEADEEIIELAGKLKCPVLSCDYDFCLCENVTFISWGETLLEGRFFKFDRERFLREKNISASVLPLLPVLVNDDHFQMNLLGKVTDRKINKDNKIKEAFNWLRNKDFETAKSRIISALSKERLPNLLEIKRKTDFVVENYTKPEVTLDSTFRENHVVRDLLQKKGIQLNIKRDDIIIKYGVPENIAKIYREGRLPSLILDMLTHKEFNARVSSIECLKEPSIHEPSRRLIEGIYGLLLRHRDEKPPINLKIRKGTTFEDANSEELYPLTFSNTENLKILYEIFEIEEPLQEILTFFDNDWFVFILAFIYFKRECKIEIFHSILLTAFVLNVLKNKNEFPGSSETRISHHFRNLNEGDKKNYFSIHPITMIKKTDNMHLGNIFHTHMYFTFQICLHYTIQIVNLLDLPYDIKISDFVNGSLFHAFFLRLETKSDCFNFVKVWFDGFEGFEKLYRLIADKLDSN